MLWTVPDNPALELRDFDIPAVLGPKKSHFQLYCKGFRGPYLQVLGLNSVRREANEHD